MKYSPRTQFALLAFSALMAGICSTGWWLASPGGVRRTSEALVLLVGAICCIQECRRMPVRSPLVLSVTLIGLAVVLFGRYAWPLFSVALAAVVVLAWTGVAIARTVARYRQSPTRRTRGKLPVQVAIEER